ncbi:MAG: cytochrome b/b6 domain-containing protein [Nitrospiraceae bacterium]|nr:cytochrome b/b6 domain-containing protein [Nitrospiraceae bacterium]
MKKVKIWDMQTRIFHWALALFTGYALVSSGISEYFGLRLLHTDPLLAPHMAAGAAAVILILFRIFWGFKGPHYSQFRSLILRPNQVVQYLKSVARKQKVAYIGHNPAASWFAVATIVLSLLVFLTGMIAYGVDESRGVFAFLHADYHMYAGEVKLAHGLSALFLLTGIFIHVSGVSLETARHGFEIAGSMITGKKHGEQDEVTTRISIAAAKLSFVLIASSFLAALSVYASVNAYKPDEIAMPEVYKEECASCHMAYTPNMLPSRSWRAMMANLEDHFGEDATIGGAEKAEIEKYLVAGAAERSLEEFSIKFSASIQPGNAPLSATEIDYWKRKHDLIKPEVYKRESIKSRSNCLACHKWAERGSFEDNHIRIPKV